MHSKFVTTSNVLRFLTAVSTAEARGAGEAGWVGAIGEPGLGKTRTLEWWAIRRQAVFLRAKPDWSPTWMLRELNHALDQPATGDKQSLYARAMQGLGDRRCPIVVDEVEQTRKKPELLETIRGLTDLTEVELVIGGTADALRLIGRQAQQASRVSAVAEFQKITLDDVILMAAQLCEVPVARDLAAEIHRQSNGYAREVKNALREVERVGLVNGAAEVTLAAVAGRELCRNRRALLGAGGGRR